MRKITSILASALLVISLGACGGGAQNAPESSGGDSSAATEEAETPVNPLEEVIQRAQTDFADTSQGLIDAQQALFSEVGDTYDGYLENVDRVQEWYDLAVSETEALGERAVEYGREYYQAVVDNVDVTDDRELEKATEEFYDAIYEDAFEDYYDAIYEDAFDEMYDAYYDGIIDEAYDVTPYDEWADARSDAYEAWSDAHSDVYGAWSDARSDVYGDYSDVRSAFYSNDFDVEGIFAPVEIQGGGSSDAGEQDDGSSDDSASTDASGVSEDFKATMDEYEAFFDDYVEFLQAYNDDPTSAELITQYSGMMMQYTETMTALSEVDTDSLSAADAAYYTEVMLRITEKISEAA